MNESDLSHLATTTTTSRELLEKGFTDQQSIHPPNRKRARKTNPAYSTPEDERAAVALSVERTYIETIHKEFQDRQLAAANVFIPTGEGGCESLTTITGSSTTLVDFSKVSKFEPNRTDKGEYGFGLTSQSFVTYFKRCVRPQRSFVRPEDIKYNKKTLILIHKLLPLKTTLHDKIQFLIFPLAPDSVYGQPNRKIYLTRNPFPNTLIKAEVCTSGVLDELFGFERIPYLDHTDVLDITSGLETYLGYEDTTKLPSHQVYDCHFDLTNIGLTVDVETEPESEVVDIVIDSHSEESNQFLRLNYEQYQPESGFLSPDSQSQPIYENSTLQEILPCPTRPSQPFLHQQQQLINLPISVIQISSVAASSNRKRKLPPHTSNILVSNTDTPPPSPNNLVLPYQEQDKVVKPTRPKRKYNKRVKISTDSINGVDASTPPPGKVGALYSRVKPKAPGRKDPDMENRPKEKVGFAVRCLHCGICSYDLHLCHRCRKPFTPNDRVIPDPGIKSTARITSDSIKRLVRAPTIKEEVVVLSSDEDEVEMKQKLIPTSTTAPCPATPNRQEKVMTPPSTLTLVAAPSTVTLVAAPSTSTVKLTRPQLTTVKLTPPSSSAVKLAPPPPSTVVTALVPNSQPNTSIKTEQPPPVATSPMASTPVTTLVAVSTLTIKSDELVPEDMNPPATQLPVSVIFPKTPVRINIGSPNPIPRPQFNIFRSRNGDGNKSQPISVQGTNNLVSTVATNNSRTPEQVIALIEALKADGGQQRTDGVVNQFTTFQCRSIRVGSSRAIKGSHNLVTMSDFGILFDFPHSRTEAIVRCAVPVEQVLSLHTHYSARLPLLIVTTSPRYAVWLRERLGMTDPAMPNFFCPLKGGNSQKHLMFMLEKFTALDIGVINRTFKRALIELDYDKANTLLMQSTLEDNKQGQLIPTPASVVVQPQSTAGRPVSTTVTPASTPILTTAASNTRSTRERMKKEPEPTPVPRQLLITKLGNNPLATTLLTTDLLCLAEEQFLNDQMIDFWLEYTLSKLSETNRARTHAFSTFFYKCLTTRPKRRSCAPWENDNKLSAAEKRHCRVKKWTKNVDIFSKDFIIIPINEK